ncbi:MAG: cysteine desulfurase family protein [Candidatus Sedimenticola endophacoides]
MSDSTYFDYNATTPVCSEAKDAVISALDVFANPSAAYQSAKYAKEILAESRQRVAALINAEPEQIFFTSGGTEANNWVINTVLGYLPFNASIVSSAIEHDAILDALRGYCVQNDRQCALVAPQPNGIVDAKDLVQPNAPGSAGFIALMFANNETGAIQPVCEVGQMTRDTDIFFHVDAVQAVGKIPVDVQKIGCDTLSISAHKFHGPKGIGALYVRNTERFAPWILGGAQERGFRSGTENLPGIAGMGAAAKTALESLSDSFELLHNMRRRLATGLDDAGIAYTVNSPDLPYCLPNTFNLSFAGVRAEALAAYLSLKYNIEVSIGSACGNNKNTRQSHVLKAMGLDQDRINGAIRVSFGKQTQQGDIDCLIESLLASLQQLANISPEVNKEQCVE